MVRFGGSDFNNCSVPLVFDGRHFIYESGDHPSVTVIGEQDGRLVFEVLRNEPVVSVNHKCYHRGIEKVDHPA